MDPVEILQMKAIQTPFPTWKYDVTGPSIVKVDTFMELFRWIDFLGLRVFKVLIIPDVETAHGTLSLRLENSTFIFPMLEISEGLFMIMVNVILGN